MHEFVQKAQGLIWTDTSPGLGKHTVYTRRACLVLYDCAPYNPNEASPSNCQNFEYMITVVVSYRTRSHANLQGMWRLWPT